MLKVLINKVMFVLVLDTFAYIMYSHYQNEKKTFTMILNNTNFSVLLLRGKSNKMKIGQRQRIIFFLEIDRGFVLLETISLEIEILLINRKCTHLPV